MRKNTNGLFSRLHLVYKASVCSESGINTNKYNETIIEFSSRWMGLFYLLYNVICLLYNTDLCLNNSSYPIRPQ